MSRRDVANAQRKASAGDVLKASPSGDTSSDTVRSDPEQAMRENRGRWEMVCAIADDLMRYEHLCRVSLNLLASFAMCAKDRHEKHGDAERDAALVSEYKGILESLGVDLPARR